MLEEQNFRRPKVGDMVNAIQKQDYASGKLTTGKVVELLTSKYFHPRGIKVKLAGGIVARVQSFVDEVGKQERLAAEGEAGEKRVEQEFDKEYFADEGALR